MIVLDVKNVPVVIVTAARDAALRPPALGLEDRLRDLGASALHCGLQICLLGRSPVSAGGRLWPHQLRGRRSFVFDGNRHHCDVSLHLLKLGLQTLSLLKVYCLDWLHTRNVSREEARLNLYCFLALLHDSQRGLLLEIAVLRL